MVSHSPEPGALPWPDAQFTRLVNDALKSYHSVLALARSPLANSALVAPLLVLDDLSPTAEERGQALRLVLWWAVDQLAPGRMRFPLGVYRPPDDPTWRDPHWWRYNILRHRYVEPLHPDGFVEGGRFTETLIALTGIPSADTFFDERNRAVREAAQWLRRQMLTDHATEALQQIAVDAAYLPLEQQPGAAELLGIAATFSAVFPRALLSQMAAAERLAGAEEALDLLARHRLLLMGDRGRNLWLSPVLQRIVSRRQARDRLAVRHARAASYFMTNGEPLAAAQHFVQARQWPAAATLLLGAAQELIDEMQVDELCQTLEAFTADQLPSDLWRDTRLLLSDLLAETGRQAGALAACRQALQVATDPGDQARIYRRMGKLHEKQDQLHALSYYQQAIALLNAGDPELVRLLKDRASLHILRQEWSEAEADLTAAQNRLAQQPGDLRADVYDALVALHRHRRQFAQAIRFARMALAQHEKAGDLLRVAKSFHNLGLIYNDMGDPQHAISAFREGIAAYEQLGNRDLIAGALLNIGRARHLDGQRPAAIESYQESLALCQKIGLPLVEVRARYYLAEAFAALGQADEAKSHWLAGYHTSLKASFDNEAESFRTLQAELPILADIAAASKDAPEDASIASAAQRSAPSPEDQEILDLAQRQGAITTRALIAATGVSKATATRRLVALADEGRLLRFGAGRGAYYAPAEGAQDRSPERTDAPNPPELARASLRQALSVQSAVQLARFGVNALGVVETLRPAAASPRTVVRLAHELDLTEFFALEAELENILGRPVHLMPERALVALYPTHTVTWVWQAAAVQA